MSEFLKAIFEPKSVAVIGASSVPGKSGYFFTKELLNNGFNGKVYPINPKGGDIDGYPMYRNLDEVGKKVDLALFVVNKNVALQSVADCASYGVRAGILYTAGFAEMGGEGREIQKKMVRIANEGGMRLVGPNCMGVFSASSRLNLVGMEIPSGNIGFVSQSGNVGITLWHDAMRFYDTGFSRFVGFGNQADIAVHEYLEYFADDPETKVIAIYVEGLRAGSGLDFIKAAQAATKKKPVVILKGGRSNAGRRAAGSHTGSLAGNDALYSAAFKKAGLIEVKNLDELLPVAQTLMNCPTFKGRDLAVAGSGGGHMINCTDAAERYGFNIPPFSEKTHNAIGELLYDFAPKGNPFDQAGTFIDNLDVWAQTTRLALSEPNIGGAYVFGDLGGYMPDLVSGGVNWNEAMHNLTQVSKETGKPIVAYSLCARDDYACNHTLRAEGIPVFDSPALVARCLAALREREEINNTLLTVPEAEKGSGYSYPEFEKASKRKAKNLTEPEVYSVLEKNCMQVRGWAFCRNKKEAESEATKLGYPVVMKVVSPQIIHKSDFGGVKTGLTNMEAVVKAYDDIMENVKAKAPEAEIDGVVVAKMNKGIEIIAGVISDKQFGPVLMAGLGGIFVEIMKDVDFSILPASQEEIRSKIEGLKSFPLLNGARGSKKANVDALVDILFKLGNFAYKNTDIAELDLNPIFVNDEGAFISDARIIVK
ncbi:MAG: acetate--CoA ligase family protein [Synergistes jonesii]|uniref:acetate--CoA ligase family protein n=1 Tax=Synergistes jonesii TaxID=2754 RepID=UPI002A7624B1|nr:acetate--CoA ligase family protein [Synergistes jonesii]MDY2985588.1 acetate--CoA ligase family protein [Synergistes jonesii]